MGFHEVRFPASLSFGAVGGPERRTEVVTLANGFEERNTPWAHSKRRYDAGLGMRSLDDVELLIAFYEARQGQLYGFRWKDWADYKSGKASAAPHFEDQVIAIGDGVSAAFPLTKTYASGEAKYVRPVTKPVSGTVVVGIQGDQQQEAIRMCLLMAWVRRLYILTTQFVMGLKLQSMYLIHQVLTRLLLKYVSVSIKIHVMFLTLI